MAVSQTGYTIATGLSPAALKAPHSIQPVNGLARFEGAVPRSRVLAANNRFITQIEPGVCRKTERIFLDSDPNDNTNTALPQHNPSRNGLDQNRSHWAYAGLLDELHHALHALAWPWLPPGLNQRRNRHVLGCLPGNAAWFWPSTHWERDSTAHEQRTQRRTPQVRCAAH